MVTSSPRFDYAWPIAVANHSTRRAGLEVPSIHLAGGGVFNIDDEPGMRVLQPHFSDQTVDLYRMFKIVFGGKRMVRPGWSAERNQSRRENNGNLSFHSGFSIQRRIANLDRAPANRRGPVIELLDALHPFEDRPADAFIGRIGVVAGLFRGSQFIEDVTWQQRHAARVLSVSAAFAGSSSHPVSLAARGETPLPV